jgi:toxin ParE1/3/4
MARRVIFRREAKAEFVAAGAWYDSKQVGLALEFTAEISRCISLAVDNPEKFPIHRRDIRCIVARRFPYKVYFRVELRSIVILAVFHSKRDPSGLLGRE